MASNTTINSSINFINVKDSLSLATLMFVGHLGFTLLHVGLCQPKNSSSIIINNVFSIGISAILYWAVGYAFAFGHASNFFLSHSRFFLMDASNELLTWYWQCGLATLFIVIANGGFVERMKFWVYPVFAVLFSGFFYPVASHWSWQKEGWLYNTLKDLAGTGKIRLIDYGGAGSIHVSAGSIALIGGLFLRPRRDRQTETGFKFVGGQTNINIFLGGFLSMISLLVKNSAASTGNLSTVNSLLAAASASITAFMFKRSDLMGENWNTKTLISGALTGLVAVSANPDSYHPYGAFAIGLIAGIIYTIWSVTLKHWRFDDVVDTVAIHLGGGIWGLIAGAFFNKSIGTFYSGTEDAFKLFGWHLLAAVVYFAWHGIALCLLFLPFHLAGALRFSTHSKVHLKGMDVHVHNERAYPPHEDFSEDGKSKTIPVWSTFQRSQRLAENELVPASPGKSYENYPYYMDVLEAVPNQERNSQGLSWNPE